MTFFDDLPYHDRNGIAIYPDFRNILKFDSILEDERISDSEKMLAGLQLLYGQNIPGDLAAAVRELQWFYSRGEPQNEKQKRKEPVFDFEEDAPYIASAFMDAYGIDLFDKNMHLHWWRFIALFVGLPETTQMVKRMCDRCVDTRKMKGETKRLYEERKKAVALKKKKTAKTPTEKRKSKQELLDRLYKEAEANLKKDVKE